MAYRREWMSTVAEQSGTSLRELVVAPAWIGDMVMAGPLITQIARSGAEVHVLAPVSTVPIAERMQGVCSVHEMPAGHGELQLQQRYRLGRRLKTLEFSSAYVLPNTLKSTLVPWFARIPRRVGYRGEHRFGLLNDMRPLDVAAVPRLVDRYLRLALPPGSVGVVCDVDTLPPLSVDEANLAALRRTHALGDGAIVCLCPGAEFGTAKRWPERHYAAVARQCLKLGFEVWLLGSSSDRATCGKIALEADGVTDLCGRTRLGDAIDLISAAAVVVTNDSGLMHVAAALDRRVVALFGSTSAEFTPPLGKRATVLQTSISCRPCFQRICPLGHQRCLTELDPAAVMELIVS